MKFREEVFSKIFTYITVILLLCIIIFVAWSLQNERADLQAERENAAALQEELSSMTARNVSLQEENQELQIFQNTWLPYAAFTESSEVLSLRTDLYTRPDLIPEAALSDVRDYFDSAKEAEAENQEAIDDDNVKAADDLQDDNDAKDADDAQDDNAAEDDSDAKENSGTGVRAEKEDEEEAEERELEFQFDNPDGENVFLPLSMDAVELQSCLIYTVAYEKEEDLSIELIYEIVFEEGNLAVRDENGEVKWNCIAYNVGNGWKGMEGEENAGD